MGVLVKLIRQLNDAARLTSILVSHDVAETLQIADYVYIIAQQTVIAEGTPHALQQQAEPWVQQFLQGLPDGPVPLHYPALTLKDHLGVA